ncbi:MAG: bifunctional diaminohydroxyphosphoribosylaminopyrimidine deaminase/5-amino-6-(5-phosphoribosylamino)uracil reductase RibD [Planctomycetaceae bacterium]|nr:bifunctional diaminohydroxyphosphoribosylaminopyrimidine deaminase/5-amino-6-(5-phosphoribosylamino)uracil reductase RibD [Planctomycetaceae bacterium]
MRHALALAARGRGFVEPNPMVGAVVLDSAGNLVGEGWHQKFGGPHAEVFAFATAGERARGGTLIVTLEPCCHHGKTPPCTDAVLRSGVKRVVVAMADPFPKVAGGGLQILRDAGVEVIVGVCAAEAEKLNVPYRTLLRTGRPWVHLKWAMTLDGKIATHTGDSKWISGEESRKRVHELRGRVDAVLVGRGTVIADDPLLTARPAGPRIAARVVVSASGDLPERCQLRATARNVPVLLYTSVGNEGKLAGWRADGAEVIAIPASDNALSPDAILADLGTRRFTNVLVEGGAGLLGSFLDAKAADEFHVFIAPKLVGGDTALSPVGGRGVKLMADALELAECAFGQSGRDVYVHGFGAPG